MKAFLLAAGLGTRLRPVTDSLPKCLVDIGGRPLLDIWLDALAKAGIDEVLINTHYFADQVEAHVADRGSPLAVTLSHEAALLGSAGTLLANSDYVSDEDMFLAINGDNLTDFDLEVLIATHLASRALASLSVFPAAEPKNCGIVETDADGRVIGFVEKPPNPKGNLANAGMYAFSPAVLNEIPAATPSDIGHHLLPRLVGRARAVPIGSSFFMDIGTPSALARARDAWPAESVL